MDPTLPRYIIKPQNRCSRILTIPARTASYTGAPDRVWTYPCTIFPCPAPILPIDSAPPLLQHANFSHTLIPIGDPTPPIVDPSQVLSSFSRAPPCYTRRNIKKQSPFQVPKPNSWQRRTPEKLRCTSAPSWLNLGLNKTIPLDC